MSRLIARRVRSRDQETESTNRRIMRRGSVSTQQVEARSITESRQWPGGPRVRPGDLTPETVQELDGRFTGAFLRVAVPAQTWEGALVLGDVLDAADWPAAGVFPKRGYYDVHPVLPVSTPGDLSWTLTVDGAVRTSGSTWAGGTLANPVPTGPVRQGEPWALVNDGGPLELGDGELVVQLVDRVGAQAAEPGLDDPEYVAAASDSTGLEPRDISFSAPSATQSGDMMVFVWCGRQAGEFMPAGVTTVHTLPSIQQVQTGVYTALVGWKWADGDDEAGTRTYLWPEGDAGRQSAAVFVFRPGAFSPTNPFGGDIVSDGVADDSGEDYSLSGTAPQGGWVMGLGFADRSRTTTGAEAVTSQAYRLEFQDPVQSLVATIGGQRRAPRFSLAVLAAGGPLEIEFGFRNTGGWFAAVEVS